MIYFTIVAYIDTYRVYWNSPVHYYVVGYASVKRLKHLTKKKNWRQPAHTIITGVIYVDQKRIAQ